MSLTIPRRSQIYLPDVRKSEPPVEPASRPDNPCALPDEAWQLYQRIRNSPEQRRDRSKMRCHPLLVEAARQRVVTIFQENHFSHTRRDFVDDNGVIWPGQTVNEFLRGPQIRWRLPVWYPTRGNSCESLGGNTVASEWRSAADYQYDGWAESPEHADHIFGRNKFYAGQTEIGLWYLYEDGAADVDAVWCFLSAPPELIS